jgi:hypothetical protein
MPHHHFTYDSVLRYTHYERPYVASGKETPGGNACAWFLPLPVPVPNNCMLQTPRSIHAYYSLIIASRNRFISLGKYYYNKQENHQYI